MKKIILLVISLAILAYQTVVNVAPDRNLATDAQFVSSDEQLGEAFENRQSGIQIIGSGRVARLLSDDTKGSQHQRFILELNSGQRLLIAHNIDLANRIDSLSTGDNVVFNGQYEWNNKGGVIHWTHHDPKGRRPGGWLQHQGKTYQ